MKKKIEENELKKIQREKAKALSESKWNINKKPNEKIM